jgi:hypothetical protein
VTVAVLVEKNWRDTYNIGVECDASDEELISILAESFPGVAADEVLAVLARHDRSYWLRGDLYDQLVLMTEKNSNQSGN